MQKALSIILLFMFQQLVATPAIAQSPPKEMVGILNLRERAFGPADQDSTNDNTRSGLLVVEIRTTHPVNRSTPPEQITVSRTQFEALKISEDGVPGIIVYGHYNDWLRVRLDDVDVWLKREPIDGYMDYPEFLGAGYLSYLQSPVIRVADYPGGPMREVRFAPSNSSNLQYFEPAVDVIGRAVIQDFEAYDERARKRYGHSHTKEYWLKITLPEATCADEAVVAEGEFITAWIRARDENDDYTVAFISGGC
ncbi:MAG: hypothetical protein AAFQ29_08285 [Pseudomonadota bacterium]